jgi:VanZ family protein
MNHKPMKPGRQDRLPLGWLVIGLLYAGLFLITLHLAYTGNLPPALIAIPFYDKVGHVVLYAIPTYLGQWIFNFRQFTLLQRRYSLWTSLFMLFTMTEEAAQAFSPNRTFSYVDLLCSLTGIGLGYWLADWVRSRMKP